MKRPAVLFAAGLATLLFCGPALAQGTGSKSTSGSSGTSQETPSSKSTAPSSKSAPPAEKPGMMSMPHTVTGSVVSVDKQANTLAVKDSKGKELSLVADNETAPELARLKAGDHVKVTYKKDKDQMVATKITTTNAKTSTTK